MRLQNWESLLYEFVQDPANHEFKWGANDCVMFCGRCIAFITDEDPLAKVLDVWTDEASAEQVIEQYGSLHGAVCSVMGQPLENPLMAKRGDLALVQLGEMDFLAMHLGDCLVAPSRAGGLVRVHTHHADVVWPVGRVHG
jgi:hypothetical protein